MITFEPELMQRIVERTKHVRIKALDLRGRLFLAQSGSDPDVWYRIRLTIAENGLRQGECSCSAGQYGMPCRHLAAAVAFLRGVQGMRRGVERHGARSEAARPTQADLDAAPLLKSAPEGPKEGCTNV